MTRIAILAVNLAALAPTFAAAVPFMPCCFNSATGAATNMPCCFVGNLLMMCCQRFFS
jgi:hypothetical protein